MSKGSSTTPYLLCLLSGALLVFAYAPFNQWWLAPIALFLFLWQLNADNQIKAWKKSFVFGLGWFGCGVSWVHVSLANFGGLPLWGSLGLMALLVLYLSLFPALFGWLFSKAKQQQISLIFAAPVAWGLSEWLRSWVLTGFPWLGLGYSQINGPFDGVYPLFGETGMAVMLILMAQLLVMWWNRQLNRFYKMATMAVLLAMTLSSLISWTTLTGERKEIALVQGNIKQDLRWVPEQDWPTMEKYLDLTEKHWQADLIVWPEAAVPKLELLSGEYLKHLDEKAKNAGNALITGIVDYNFETKNAFNNLIVVGKVEDDGSPDYHYGHPNRYSKHHLLPIGEFVPMEDFLRNLAPIFDLPMSSFTAGNYRQNNLVANGIKIASAICFEIAFPQQVVDNVHPETDALLTVSNDAWFGSSHGPHQHFEIARVRARELALPVIRSTNNGVTGIIDHRGNTIAYLPQFKSGTMTVELPLVKGQTLYRWSNGYSYWSLLIVLAVLGLWRRHNIMRSAN